MLRRCRIESFAICDGVRFVPENSTTFNATHRLTVHGECANLAANRYESRVFDYICMTIRHGGPVCVFVACDADDVRRNIRTACGWGIRVSRTNAFSSGAGVHISGRTCSLWQCSFSQMAGLGSVDIQLMFGCAEALRLLSAATWPCILE